MSALKTALKTPPKSPNSSSDPSSETGPKMSTPSKPSSQRSEQPLSAPTPLKFTIDASGIDSSSSSAAQKHTYAHTESDMAGKFEEVPVEKVLDMLPTRHDIKRKRLNVPKAMSDEQEKAQYGLLIKALEPFLAAGWEFVYTPANGDYKIEKIYQQTVVKPDLSLYAETGFTSCNMKKLQLFGQSTTARLLCHSRAGTRVSRAFDINGPENYLGEFLWRFSHAPESARGHDTSVQRVKGKKAAANARKALGLKQEADLFQVIVDTEKFIFAQPFTSSHRWPVGRGTRCYLAYWVKEKKVVLLKDTWRREEYGKEGDVYEILRSKQVRNIATIVCHRDVDDQNPLQFVEGTGGRKLRHYRIVLEEVGEPLNRFKSTWELVKVMSDAFAAHRDAFEKAEILHRDISFGNILLVRSGDEVRGRLIDWELAKVKDHVKARTLERIGTFQFLSLRLLKNYHREHLASDDIQSFLHVLVWVIIRHGPTALTKDERVSRLKSFDLKDTLTDAYTAKFDMFNRNVARNLYISTVPFAELVSELLVTLSCAITYEDSLDRPNVPKVKEERDAWQKMQTHDFMGNVMEESLKNLEWKQMNDGAANCAITYEDSLDRPNVPKVKEERDAWEKMQTHDFISNAIEESLKNLEWKQMKDGAAKYLDD
ncbi:hypothetical protein BT69DRAFT_1315424 [Atractiella rhizophila]|nr:hypothetical protein BT69DRAFT_1315424 [Atractiella rhizophila]